jgi:aminoglycoside phosphotransferase family enzyme/predicted kinase
MGIVDLPGALLRPAAYPWRPATVELVETHISWVFLAGDHVVKLKRPIDLGFVDHTTLERRRHSCNEEIRLNRRLTSDVYLGVAPITQETDGLAVNGGGPVVEWATLMRRLPATAMLDALLKDGHVPADLGDRLADRLVPFHARHAPAFPGTADALAQVTVGVVLENLDELAAFPVAPIESGLVSRVMHEYAPEHAALFRDRADAGQVRDGHGDLRCEHICIEPGRPVQIFDCVEFSPELRCVDVASDLAFLLMDLDRLGAATAAARLLARYRGAGFDLPDGLLRWYWAHRALVRAKVWCLRDPDGLAFADRAVAYLHHAARQVLTVRPALVCMSGLSGTGKSTVARQLAAALPVAIRSSDQVRKGLAGVTDSSASAWEQGIYSDAWTDATYDKMFDEAAAILDAGQAVVLDATLLEDMRREQAVAVVETHGVPLVLVETTCDDIEVRRRLLARASHGTDPSDAGIAIYERQLTRLRDEPPAVPTGAIHVTVDTTLPTAALLEPVVDALSREAIVLPHLDEAPVRFHAG